MITMKDIVRDGHPVLRQKAEKVDLPLTESDKKTMALLLEYIKNSQDPEIALEHDLRPGIGLAAPQINVSKQMFALHLEDQNGREYSFSIANPKIISHSVDKTYLTSGEGCLSVDENIPGYVVRYARITVRGIDIDGAEVKYRLKGLAAVAAQHEIDHLNGIMFYDHINHEDPFKEPADAEPLER
ncbi:peptide deformylase [Jeotgalibacillus haloalkalitolerans]|uniref:Peptide deformylase n=1 Tax=Jeotgalibacillus haloalkalitolerans TaxID=3104292 RepID=A0ABU5KNZ8_9BACL|nr:peptide deformylase [Jeotgalibacillus sp. HH7-29]MDZ5712900.1 peptide deformylase [Jeotgalibacillus sp. HH7-29]